MQSTQPVDGNSSLKVALAGMKAEWTAEVQAKLDVAISALRKIKEIDPTSRASALAWAALDKIESHE